MRIEAAAVAGSALGAFFAAGIGSEVLRPVIMGVLLAVLAFVVLRPSFGTDAPATGPVTGTFLVLTLTAAQQLTETT